MFQVKYLLLTYKLNIIMLHLNLFMRLAPENDARNRQKALQQILLGKHSLYIGAFNLIWLLSSKLLLIGI